MRGREETTKRNHLLGLILFLSFSLLAAANVKEIHAQVGLQVPQMDVVVLCMKSIGGRTWLGTSGGLFRISGTVPRRIPDMDVMVWCIEEINQRVWLGTSKGIYRVDGDVAHLVGDQDLNVFCIK